MNKMIYELKNIDKSILSIIKSGIKFCFIFCIFATLFLFTYDYFYASPNLFYIGISLFKSGLFFMVAFVICGIAFNTIEKELN